MTPEKFFDYLEGKLPADEKQELERALIADPELQQELFNARQIHRGLQRMENGESPAAAVAGARARMLFVAFTVLVALNVAIGLFFVFRANKVPPDVQRARHEALRHQLESSVEKSAAAAFPAPTLGIEQVTLKIPRTQQDAAAKAIIEAAEKAGGSGTKGLPNDDGFSVLVIIPGSAEGKFRLTLASLGGPAFAGADASPAPSPNESVRFEIALVAPR